MKDFNIPYFTSVLQHFGQLIKVVCEFHISVPISEKLMTRRDTY